MSRPARHARTKAGRRIPMLVGALLVAALATALVAEIRLSGSQAPQTVAATGDLADAAAADLRARGFGRPTPDRAGSRSHARPRVPAKQVPAKQPVREAEELARKATKVAAKTPPVEKAPAPGPFDVRIGSFNVLGSQHTAPGGDRRNFPPASVRNSGAVTLIGKHGVEILGTQELQDDQLAALQSRTGMAAYPGLAWGSAETDNSILYDADRFKFVSGSKFTIPFMGRPRPQPILRLEELATGREFYVVNTHPSAHDGRYLVERRQGQSALVGVVNQLKQSGLPVLVTGDMNDREEFYCRVVPAAGLVAPNGGSYGSGCQPPPSPIPVDWVVGGGGVSWSGYWRDTTSTTKRISDHIFISATAHVG